MPSLEIFKNIQKIQCRQIAETRGWQTSNLIRIQNSMNNKKINLFIKISIVGICLQVEERSKTRKCPILYVCYLIVRQVSEKVCYSIIKGTGYMHTEQSKRLAQKIRRRQREAVDCSIAR